MPTKTDIWSITDNTLTKIDKSKLDLEARIEEWIKQDISLVSDHLLVIGQQVPTDYTGGIDLLALDHEGNLVILELKRDKTPRDIVAQTLDYASCIKDWSHEKVVSVAKDYLKEDLEISFQKKFNKDLPDILNDRHRVYIVGSEIDSSTERIVTYLSEELDMDINIATFTYFKSHEQEFVTRTMLLDEDHVEERAATKSKKRISRSMEYFYEQADDKDVGDLFKYAFDHLKKYFQKGRPASANIPFTWSEAGSKVTIISVYPEYSDPDKGLFIAFLLNGLPILLERLQITKDELFPERRELAVSPYVDAYTRPPDSTFYFNQGELQKLIALFDAKLKTM